MVRVRGHLLPGWISVLAFLGVGSLLAVTPLGVVSPSVASAAPSSAGTVAAANWPDGQRVLIQRADVSAPYRYTVAAEDWVPGLFTPELLRACAAGNALLAQVPTGGPDVALGSAFGTSADDTYVGGSTTVGSIALRAGDAASSEAAYSLTSSTKLWNCFVNHVVQTFEAQGATAHNGGVAALTPADQQGLSAAIQIKFDRTTSNAPRVAFTDYITFSSVRVGNDLALVYFDGQDNRFPDTERIRLTLVVERRLEALSEATATPTTAPSNTRPAPPTTAPRSKSDNDSSTTAAVLVGLFVALLAVVLAVLRFSRRGRADQQSHGDAASGG